MSCVVCTVYMKTRSTGFLVEPQNEGRRFSNFYLKIDSSGLVIWASKSLRRFLGLDLKIEQAMIYRLCHKTDGRMIQRGAQVEI
jgi:hypothetical protein